MYYESVVTALALSHSTETFKTLWADHSMNLFNLAPNSTLCCLTHLLTHLSECCFQALEDAFLAIDSRMTTEEVIKELVQIAGRPTEEPPAEKVAEEDDCECTPNNKTYVIMFGMNISCKKHKVLTSSVMHGCNHLKKKNTSRTWK